VDRTKLGKLMLLFLVLPFAAYLLIDCIAGYIPPTESYQKTPYQFEAAFNEQMAQYGMSIDIDSVNFTYGSGAPYKIVPVRCEDNCVIEITYYPTSERRKSIIRGLEFAQTIQGAVEETIYLTPILEFMIREFQLTATDESSQTQNDRTLSFQQALEACNDFINGTDEKRDFLLEPKQTKEFMFRLRDIKKKRISLSYLSIWKTSKFFDGVGHTRLPCYHLSMVRSDLLHAR
jgi:hypothetical protein